MNYNLIEELIESIHKEPYYLNFQQAYITLMNNQDVKSLMQTYERLKQELAWRERYGSYIDNSQLKNDILGIRKQLVHIPEFQDYQEKLSLLNRELDSLSEIIFHNISEELAIGRMGKVYARHRRKVQKQNAENG